MASDTLELPAFKGRPGWEFTDISELDLDAYEPGEVSHPTAGAELQGALWDFPSALPVDGVTITVDDQETVITVARGVDAGTIHLAAIQSRDMTLVNQRTRIVLEEGARAEVWEQLLSPADLEGVFNVRTDLEIGQAAHLRYVCGQALSEKSWIFGAQRALIGRDGSLDWVALGFGSRSGHVLMETRLAGEGAEARVTGAYATHGSQHIDFDTTQEHAAPHTTSDLAFRGVLQDRSSAVWKGNIIVDPGAQKTDAFQDSRNLLISKRAHADAIPGLEIQANDVRCTHAAAVAQVDPEQIFYLRSHGLGEAEAKQLVIEGFLSALVERFESGPVREVLAAALEARLALILG